MATGARLQGILAAPLNVADVISGSRVCQKTSGE
jgi:hypothetical protein